MDTVERELGVDALLHRWSGAEDGAFVICSCWLAECLARAGEVDRARAVFDRVTAHANDLGLLAEQIDTETGELLSNFPQTFSHAGLINAAWAIDRAATKVEVDQPWESAPTGWPSSSVSIPGSVRPPPSSSPRKAPTSW